MVPPPVTITMKEIKNDHQAASSTADQAKPEDENAQFKYVSLINRSASFNSSIDGVGVICSNDDGKIKHGNSDQQLPDCAVIATSSSESVKQSLKSNVEDKLDSLKPPTININCKKENKNKKPIFNSYNLDTHSPLAFDKCDFKVKKIQPTHINLGRSVPNCSRMASATSLNTMTNISLNDGASRRADGQLVLNPIDLNYHMEPEEDFYENDTNNSQDLSYSQIKYINIFSILCCWCFPFTGIFSIVYARLAKKYYSLRDNSNAKKYLSKSEWLLILTFFFGLTLIAISFAFLDAYYVRNLFPTNSTAAETQKRPYSFMTHIFH